MMLSNLQARRATVDDLVELRKLWHVAGLSATDLERQLRDFQVVETADGVFLGALGFHVAGRDGLLHSETYTQIEIVGEARQRLWERVQTLARNFGLYRVWMREDAPFWKSAGFEPASGGLIGKLPGAFGEPGTDWLVLKLRDENAAGISIEKEFELFALAQRESSERIIRQAQVVRNILYLILAAIVVLGLVLAALAVIPKSSWSRFFKTRPHPDAHEQPPGNAATNNPAPATR